MLIDRSTTIKALLDENQDPVIEALVKLNKNFSKLKNPVLRKLLAKRVSIEDACRIAGCKVPDFLLCMQDIGFYLKSEHNVRNTSKALKLGLPEGIAIEDFDVRLILAADKDPLKEILEKVKTLKSDQCLKIINSFEPTPLITLLQKKGFQTFSDRVNAELVFTYFFKSTTFLHSDDLEQPISKAIESFGETAARFHGRLKVIDVTKLEAPQPMHTILAELEVLAEDSALFVHHKKVPVYLLPHLHDQGFEYLIAEEEPGSVSILIFKP